MAAVGASFVTDVMQKSGRLEKEDLQTIVGKLLQRADDAKVVIFWNKLLFMTVILLTYFEVQWYLLVLSVLILIVLLPTF